MLPQTGNITEGRSFAVWPIHALDETIIDSLIMILIMSAEGIRFPDNTKMVPAQDIQDCQAFWVLNFYREVHLSKCTQLHIERTKNIMGWPSGIWPSSDAWMLCSLYWVWELKRQQYAASAALFNTGRYLGQEDTEGVIAP